MEPGEVVSQEAARIEKAMLARFDDEIAEEYVRSMRDRLIVALKPQVRHVGVYIYDWLNTNKRWSINVIEDAYADPTEERWRELAKHMYAGYQRMISSDPLVNYDRFRALVPYVCGGWIMVNREGVSRG